LPLVHGYAAHNDTYPNELALQIKGLRRKYLGARGNPSTRVQNSSIMAFAKITELNRSSLQRLEFVDAAVARSVEPEEFQSSYPPHRFLREPTMTRGIPRPLLQYTMFERLAVKVNDGPGRTTQENSFPNTYVTGQKLLTQFYRV
jgi:hypothetical protein